MITEQDLTEAIAECVGKRNPDANTCIKLAAYYTIMRELYGKEDNKSDVQIMPTYSFSSPPDDSIVQYTDDSIVQYTGDSEFAQAVDGKPIQAVLSLTDEVMTALKVGFPRLYDATMIKLRKI